MFSPAIILVSLSAFHRATNCQNQTGIEKKCFEAIQTDATYFFYTCKTIYFYLLCYPMCILFRFITWAPDALGFKGRRMTCVRARMWPEMRCGRLCPFPPGLPVVHDSPIGRIVPAGVPLMVPAATDEETGCASQCKVHPHPHIVHHLGLLPLPLISQ